MKRNIVQSDVVWATMSNIDETRLSTHGFYSRIRSGLFGEQYYGNGSLCNKNYGVSEDGETFLPITKIDAEPLNEETACKRCLKIFNSLNQNTNHDTGK